MAGLNVTQRPNLLKNFYGNQAVKEILKPILTRETDTFPNAFLITGPSGCGKTTIARIIANKLKAYNKNESVNFNYKELDAADFRGIDTARRIRESLQYAPVGDCKYRVWLLDECHMLTKDAQEALLKNLEDPPKHVVFLLATTEPDKLKETLRRRCVRLNLEKLTSEEMEEYIEQIYKSLNKDIPSENVIDTIVQVSQGSPGMAIKVIDSILDLDTSEKQLMNVVRNMTFSSEDQQEAIDVCRILMKAKTWEQAKQVINNVLQTSNDYENLRRAIIGYTEKILRKEYNPKAFIILDSFIAADVFRNGSSAIIHASICALEAIQSE